MRLEELARQTKPYWARIIEFVKPGEMTAQEKQLKESEHRVSTETLRQLEAEVNTNLDKYKNKSLRDIVEGK